MKTREFIEDAKSPNVSELDLSDDEVFDDLDPITKEMKIVQKTLLDKDEKLYTLESLIEERWPGLNQMTYLELLAKYGQDDEKLMLESKIIRELDYKLMTKQMVDFMIFKVLKETSKQSE